jgi:hypothetical protein
MMVLGRYSFFDVISENWVAHVVAHNSGKVLFVDPIGNWEEMIRRNSQTDTNRRGPSWLSVIIRPDLFIY